MMWTWCGGCCWRSNSETWTICLLTAGLQPDGVAAAASFHGGYLAAEENPDSPHQLASVMGAEIYVAVAANGPTFPAEQEQRLESVLTEAVRHTIETYPAGHGFAVPDNPTYDPNAEQRHWEALSDLLSRLPRS